MLIDKKIEGGTILHAWCWSFNTIKENIPQIADAGYTAVQTSPISKCLVGENGGMEIFGNGKWYYHYQPILHVIGNYQLGTKEEFVAMCEEAHKYGVKIIVDAVINHCSMDYSAIDDSVKNIEGGAFHDPNAVVWGETNRYAETQGFLNGLWDFNTQNPNVQKYLKNFLIECVESGADGFRYDTAKLIELPNDHTDGYPEYASDFWHYALDNGAAFQYGEDLQEGGEDATSSRLGEYAKLMHVTASFYGARMRKALNEANLSVDYIGDYLSYGVSPDRLVSWIESHDNYCNDKSYAEVDDEQVICGWAFITARNGSTPLFFSRPMGSNSENPWGNNIIGVAGNDSWKDKRVIAVNKFREAMRSENEELLNPDLNKKAVMIIRGKKAAVIINCDDNQLLLKNTACGNLADGKYTDEVTNRIFEVRNGSINGNVEPYGVAVLYLS